MRIIKELQENIRCATIPHIGETTYQQRKRNQVHTMLKDFKEQYPGDYDLTFNHLDMIVRVQFHSRESRTWFTLRWA